MPVDLDADHRVHTVFSSGTASVAEMVAAAEAVGVRRLVVADHVDASSDWLPVYLSAVARAAIRTPVSVHAGVTVRLVEASGRLDLPASLSGVEYIVIDTSGLALPEARRRAADFEPGVMPAESVDPADILVSAVCRALDNAARWGQPIVADPFAPLRGMGLSESGVRPDLLHDLARACRATGAAVEVNERLRSPSLPAAVVLASAGVPLLAASGAHTPAEVARWTFVSVVAQLTAPHDFVDF